MALPIWIDPLHRPADADEAFRMGRSGAIGVSINAVSGLFSAAIFWFDRGAFGDYLRASMERTMAAQGETDPQAIALTSAMTDWMVGVMPPFVAVTSVLFTLVYVVLARMQWRRPNRIIPGILLGVYVWSLLATIGNIGNMPMMSGLLGWWTAVAWVASTFAAIFLIVGFRGAGALYRFRTQPAVVDV
ncbi:MAG: hypothetical protein EON88_28205 [Brevundimonas sp.]|nr:MAG: hypothetical protein EON88_28205 [Brevundimonas sp.]